MGEKMGVKKYSWKSGSRIKADAQAVGTWINSLRDDKGSITAYEVLTAASNPSTPGHMIFTWNDQAAAHACRMNEARHILRCLQIEIITSQSEIVTQAYQIVTHDTGERYTDIGEVMIHKDWREELLARAAGDLEAFKRKYGHLKELASINRAIRNWLQKH